MNGLCRMLLSVDTNINIVEPIEVIVKSENKKRPRQN